MHLRHIAILIVLAVLWGGCLVIDVVIGSCPLGPREGALMDNSLLGKWEFLANDNSEKRYMLIYRFNDKELYLESVEGSDNTVSRGRVFITGIDNVRFMNYQAIDKYSVVDLYIYVKYEKANDNVLKIWSLNSKFFPNTKLDGKELVSFIRQNVNKSELYERPEVYIRVSEK